MKRQAILAAVALPALLLGLWPAGAQTVSTKPVDPKVLLAEKARVEAINKVKPSVVAVLSRDARGNVVGHGSGVLIDADGFALTNFHVTVGTTGRLMQTMKCGLPDGEMYDAVLVGLDKVGDVGLIKLLPRKAGDKFPFAKMGDSDKVRAGDWSLAMGNPFSLSTDFTPTVTFGLISGVHRYQYPEGTLLEYTDCIQIDTSINPGNSGGPLFNMDGELIGINGRGSLRLEKRGRVNTGVGYAISINQIKNFLGHMRVGIDTDHASLGAGMESEAEDGALSRIVVKAIIDSDARRRGLEVGDQLVSFAGRPMTTVNQFKNVLGLFPRGWRVPLVYRRENQRTEVLVRLMGVQPGLLDGRPAPPPPRRGAPRPAAPAAGPPSPAAKFFKAKEGFANYYFNEQAQTRLLEAFRKNGDFSKLTGDWKIKLGGKLASGGDATGSITLQERGAADGKSPKAVLDLADLLFPLEPLNPSEKADSFKDPPDSGGLVLALFLYRQLLVYGPKGFPREFSHGGIEPYYPPAGKEKPDYLKSRVLAEVLLSKYAGYEARWFFAQQDDPENRWTKGQLIGFEVTPDKDEDPCEVCLSDYKSVGNDRKLPGKLHVRKGGRPFADLTITAAEMK
jgi:S1-C subfamily serine protease